MGLALIATLFAIWLRVATALSEIVIGTVVQLIIGASVGSTLLAADVSWLKLLAGAGAVLCTFLAFLAGAERHPVVFRRQSKQATLIGVVSFAAPFLGCAAIARWLLDWSPEASWLAGIAISTTLVAVVYAVMLESGLNTTDYGKVALAGPLAFARWHVGDIDWDAALRTEAIKVDGTANARAGAAHLERVAPGAPRPGLDARHAKGVGAAHRNRPIALRSHRARR